MTTPFDVILAAGAVGFLAVLTLAGILLPAPDDSILTEADLDDEDDDIVDHLVIEGGEIV